jgi:hypothetical protein
LLVFISRLLLIGIFLVFIFIFVLILLIVVYVFREAKWSIAIYLVV